MVAAVIAGAVLFAAFETVANLFAISFWPDYAAAFPNRAFTVPMMIARLIAGFAGVFAAGYAVQIIAQKNNRPVFWAALLLLLLASWNHFSEPTWSRYPLWYHLLFLAYILPGMMLGGWLNQRVATKRS